MQLTNREALDIMHRLDAKMVPCSHHFRGRIEVDGKIVALVHCSRGDKAMPGHVPELFRKSLHLTRSEFGQLLRKEIGREEYVALLRMKGIV
jgi:hypothetical protein